MIPRKIATAHLITSTCKPTTVHWAHEEPYFGNFRPFFNDTMFARIKVFTTFLFVFVSVSKDAWVTLPVAIFVLVCFYRGFNCNDFRIVSLFLVESLMELLVFEFEN